MKSVIYSLLFIFLYFGSAMSAVEETHCDKNTKSLSPVLNTRAVSSLLEPVIKSIDTESLIDLIFDYYDEENKEKQETLLSQIQSYFTSGLVNPNSDEFDGGSILFNIGLNDRELEKAKVYNIVKAVLDYSGKEPVQLNIIDPLWKSSPLHQSAVSLNGKVAAALLSYKKHEGYSASPYLLDRSMPDTFLGRLPTPIRKGKFKLYYDFFVEIHKVNPDLINFPLMKTKGSTTFLSKIEAASEVEKDVFNSSDISEGLLLPLLKLGMKKKMIEIPNELWE